MAAPFVTYYDETGTNPVSEWNIGEIDAGTDSDHFIVTVWNNKGGSTAVPHMKNVTVMAVDSAGTESNIAINWIHAKINNVEDLDTCIGGSANAKSVSAIGIDPAVDGYIIKGDANDGSIGGATEHYAKYELWAVVPPNAPEGDKPLRLRTSYSYT